MKVKKKNVQNLSEALKTNLRRRKETRKKDEKLEKNPNDTDSNK